jgi:hypothetical protein
VETIELYRELKTAYTEENLHRISSFIIELFKEKQYDGLRNIQKIVNEHTKCNEEKINKIFAKLMMLYHPDRLSNFLRYIESAFQNDDFEMLFSFAHIFQVQEMKPEDIMVNSTIFEEDLAEEFGWDPDPDSFHYWEQKDTVDPWEQDMDVFSGNSFISAVKKKVYGNLNVEFPMYLLEDLEEIEMSDYEIETLEGIESCRYARVVDLSNNHLTDISELRDLMHVEILNLSNNHIGYIDSLYHLSSLQMTDLSFNDVTDIAPLFELELLQYVNLIGNRIPAWQLEKLQLKGVTVVY